MKLILSAFDYRPRLGGVAGCAHQLAEALSRQPGCEVRVLAPDQPGAEEFDQATTTRTLSTTRLSLPREATLAIAPLAWGLSREIREFRPDAVVCMLWQPDALAAWACRALFSIPFFVVAHGVELLDSSRTFKKRVRSRLKPVRQGALQASSGVFAVSSFTAALAAKSAGLPESHVQVCMNGVDLARFSPGPKSRELHHRYGLAPEAQVLLTVSRLVANKGIDVAIQAFSRIAGQHSTATYLICGTGPDHERLKSLARDAGISDRVRFCGEVSPEELVEHYRLADLFVLLSRFDPDSPAVEGFGLVYLEAAGCEVPSLGGRSGGISDAIEAGKTGWLVDPSSVGDAAEAMSRVLADDALRIAAGKAARARAQARFTWDHMAERIRMGIAESIG